MTRPRSSGCTRTSSSSPRRSEREVTVTSSGLSTTPRTRCSRASASIGLVGGLLGGRVRRRLLLGGRGGGLGGLGLALLGLVLGGLHRSGASLGGVLGADALDAQGALGARQALELLPVAGHLEQRGDLLGGLGAHGEPVLRTLGVDVDERGLLGRVVLADLLDRPAITLLATVHDDDAVVRRADLAHALETDLDCHCGGHSWFMWGGPTRVPGGFRGRAWPWTRLRRVRGAHRSEYSGS